jgi:integrase
MTYQQIADELGEPIEKLHDWQQRHASYWRFAYDQGMENMRQMINAQAGTSAVVANAPLLKSAERCDQWCRERGESLFPTSGETSTLVDFFEQYYRPIVIPDARESTLKEYRSTLRSWCLFTGNPPLAEITNGTLQRFRDCLSKSPGRQAGELKSPNTVRKNLIAVATLLAKAGPAGHHNRDGAGLIPNVPYVRAPRKILREPRFVRPELIESCYAAAAKMSSPFVRGVKPADWWRAFIVILFNTGLRRVALLSLRFSDVNWQAATLSVRAEISKTLRGQTLPLHPVVIDHLRAIQTDRQVIFEWRYHKRHVIFLFHRLQELAGVPANECFTIHDLRRTVATLHWQHSPAAAQLLLGHSGGNVTTDHYVNRQQILSNAMATLPQPAAFTTSARRKEGAA